jgi:hypothetical protein
MEVNEKVIDSEGMVYTIVCTDRPSVLSGAIAGAAAGAGSGGDTTLSGRGKCVPLTDGDRFDAEIKGTTMWVHARKGGNQGKAVTIKYKIIDIRKQTPLAMASKDDCDVREVWSLGRNLGEKDEEIAEAIQIHGVCKVLYFLRGEAPATPQSTNPPAITPPDISGPATPPFPAIIPQSSAPQPTPPSAPSPSVAASSSSKSGSQSLPSGTYTGVGGGHWISEVSSNGAIITLEDGSLWEVSALDRVDTALWLPTTNITVLRSQSPVGDFKYTLVNKDDGEKALAKYLGRE